MIFFTADPHFGHARINELANRPFRDVTHMNEMIVANWNAVVSPEDIVWVLGDIALGPIMESLEYVGRLNGTKRMVIGNHDRCFAGGRRSKGISPEEWVGIYEEAGFCGVFPDAAIVLGAGGTRFRMSHFPYAGDSHGEDRFSGFRLMDTGIALLHGHTHSKNKISRSPRGTLQINVGVDANAFTPISEEEILAIIAEES